MSAPRRLLYPNALLSGVASGTSEVINVAAGHTIALYCVYDNGVSAGEVIAESAPTSDFAGTWANEGNSVGASNTCDRISIQGPIDNLRVRIGTPIVGGNVRVTLLVIGAY